MKDVAVCYNLTYNNNNKNNNADKLLLVIINLLS